MREREEYIECDIYGYIVQEIDIGVSSQSFLYV